MRSYRELKSADVGHSELKSADSRMALTLLGELATTHLIGWRKSLDSGAELAVPWR